MLAASSASTAAIVYTDINPDVQVGRGGQDSLSIDMNADTDIDYRITAQISSGSNFSNVSLRIKDPEHASNRILCYSNYTFGTSTVYAAKPLANNYNIGPVLSGTGSWSATSALIAADIYAIGSYSTVVDTSASPFVGKGDRYIGVAFYGASVYYGWIRIAINDSNDVLTIKEYAYNDTPNTAIQAGQGGTVGLSSNSYAQDINVITNGKTVLIENKNNAFANAAIRITDLSGKTVYADKLIGKQHAAELNTIADGIYVVSLMSATGSYSSKVFLNAK